MRESLFVPVFLPGDWKISVKPVTDGATVHYPSTRTFNVQIKPHAAAEVVFEFDNQLSSGLRHAPAGAVGAVEGPDGEGKYSVIVNDPEQTISPGNVLTADASPQSPEGLLVIVESVSRDGAIAMVGARAGTLDDLGPKYHISVDENVVLPPHMKTSPEDPPYDDRLNCSTGVEANMQGNVGFDNPSIRVAVDLQNFPAPKAELDFGITATVTTSVSISAAGECGLDRRFGNWVLPPIPVAGLPVVLTPVVKLQLRGSVATGAEARVSASQSITLDAGMSGTSLGEIGVHGSASHTGSTSGLTGNDFVDMKVSAGPVIELLANGGPQVGELSTDVFLRYVANRNVGPAWGVYGGVEAGGKIGLLPWVSLGTNAILSREYLIADSGDGDPGGGGGGGGGGLYGHQPTNVFDIGVNSGFGMDFSPVSIPSFGRPRDLSCGATYLCSVVTEAFEGMVWNGFGWQSYPELELSPKVVACNSSKCVAYDISGRTVMFDGSKWSPVRPAPRAGEIVDASCGPAICLAVGPAGNVNENGDGYRLTESTLDSLSSVSCAPTAEVFCLVSGYVFQDNNQQRAFWTLSEAGWSQPTIVGPVSSTPMITEISCSSSRFCMASDAEGNVRTYDNDLLSTSSNSVGDVSSVSCPTDSYCVVADAAGNTREWIDREWQAARAIVNSGNVILKLSCPSSGFCGGLEGEPISSGGGGGGGEDT